MASKKYGLSFSLSRLLGISGLKKTVASATCIPTTRGGVERKIGNLILKTLFRKK